MKQITWKVGDEVVVYFGEDPYKGVIQNIEKSEADVLFEDGDQLPILLSELTGETVEWEDDIDEDKLGKGFNQYLIKWDLVSKSFKTNVEGGEFYGSLRKTVSKVRNQDGWSIDMWVSYQGKTYAVESIYYKGENPINDQRSADADICAAINKFLYSKLGGNIETLEDLTKQAKQPIIKIDRIGSLDRIINDLTELRRVAIRRGGQRIFSINSDVDGEPPLTLKIDVTAEAKLLEGHVPPIQTLVAKNTSSKETHRPNLEESSTISDLVLKLRDSNNPTEKRKIRATLRSLGHRGGARVTN